MRIIYLEDDERFLRYIDYADEGGKGMLKFGAG